MVQTLQSGNAAENTDPRILRTGRMLMEALASLLTLKKFEDIFIQEIVDEATLNRATFYLHYPDKNALLQAMTATRFRDLIASRGLSFTDCEGVLRAVALGVCDYIAEATAFPGQLAKMPLEGSIIPVVESMFREGAAAWAIFGAARRWYQTPDRIPAEEIATKIEALVKPIFPHCFGVRWHHEHWMKRDRTYPA